LKTTEIAFMSPSKLSPAWVMILASILCCASAVRQAAAQSVVVYSALDREFSEPILKAFGQKSRIRLLPKFDAESTKTVGLTNLIIVEAERPRCDLFWNNEILNTLRLEEKGLLSPFRLSHAVDLPDTFKALQGHRSQREVEGCRR
jgi:iron(III) transport system substrate-binding protein